MDLQKASSGQQLRFMSNKFGRDDSVFSRLDLDVGFFSTCLAAANARESPLDFPLFHRGGGFGAEKGRSRGGEVEFDLASLPEKLKKKDNALEVAATTA